MIKLIRTVNEFCKGKHDYSHIVAFEYKVNDKTYMSSLYLINPKELRKIFNYIKEEIHLIAKNS